MYKGLFRDYGQIDSKVKEHIERRQKAVELFYTNPYMQATVKEFRKKYGIPEEGFDQFDKESQLKYLKWLKDIPKKYPERWAEPPEKLVEEQKDWEELSPEEQRESVEPMEYWEPDCLVNVRQFQTELREIFNRYANKTPNDDLAAFERYVITDEVAYPMMDFDGGKKFVQHLPYSETKLLSSEKDKSGNIVKRVIQVNPPYSEITEDQPNLVIEEYKGKVSKVYVEVKPNTNLRSIGSIWNEVEKYQKQMDGYQERKRERHNLYRDSELLRMVRLEGLTYDRAIAKWNEKHESDDEYIYFETSAVQHAVERLDRLFNPDT